MDDQTPLVKTISRRLNTQLRALNHLIMFEQEPMSTTTREDKACRWRKEEEEEKNEVHRLAVI